MPDSKFSVTFLGLVSFVAMGGALVYSGNGVNAQITPDNTLGAESSVVTPNVNINGLPSERINGGAIRGANLFHSFQEFSINEGRGAYFSNPNGIENILSRVTGGNPSEILGRLGVLGNANLFLINPNGIIFGPNAQLDVGGSFIGSTASSLNFADGTQFSANSPQPIPLLTISVPIGLQYGVNPGRIQVQGNGQGTRTSTDLIDTPVGLRVQPSQTLAMVGGDVLLEGGTLKTAGGRIELGSVAAPGLVSLTPIDSGWALGYSSITSFGDIQLSGQATADASGAGGGDVQVRGRQVTFTDGSQIQTSTLGDRPGGTLNVNASDSVEVIGTSANGEFPSSLSTAVYPEATGAGGNLTIETAQLTVRDGAQIIAGTGGMGNAGSLAVRALDSMEVIGTSADGQFGSALYNDVELGAIGAGGNITIDTKRLTVRDGALVQAGTFGKGAAGNLTINATESVEVISSVVVEALEAPSALAALVGSAATGDGGSLTIETGRLTIRDGAQIYAGTLGKGKAGTLTVRATEAVELIGTLATFGGLGSALATSVEPTATGDGGNLTIETGRLTIRDGAAVSSATFSSGAAGSLAVTASELVELIGTSADGRFSSRLTARTTGSGAAGNLTIETGQLSVRDGAKVNVSSEGSGNAGNLDVAARSIRLDNNAVLSSETTAGQGNIFLDSQDLVLRYNSNITTNATGTATGGNITIDTDILAALGNSDITANAEEARGGQLRIVAQGIFGTEFRERENPATSDITATSLLGSEFSGIVEINTPDVDPSRGLVTLQTEPVNVTNLIAQDCPGSGGNVTTEVTSKFIVTGRGGLPPYQPGEPLRAEAIIVNEDRVEAGGEKPSAIAKTKPLTHSTSAPLVEATGWVLNDKGEVVLTAYPTLATPYSSSSTSTTTCYAP